MVAMSDLNTPSKLQYQYLTTDNTTRLTNRLPNIKTEPLESLTENELIHLVKGFKSLDKEDKTALIEYMKKLERSDHAMVQRVKVGMHSSV